MYHGLVNIFDLHATFSYLRSHNHIPMLFKVPMKHIVFFRSYKIYPLEYIIPKFQTSGVKIADFYEHSKLDHFALKNGI